MYKLKGLASGRTDHDYRSHTYTWLNSNKEPVKVPASQYIGLVQRWIVGKLSDNKVFPTDRLPENGAPVNDTPGRDWIGKSTGYPENFYTDCKTIFRQIFRVYAHVYHSHWLDPFWHVHSSNPPSSGWTDLNSCFVHFITVAKLFGLLTEKDLEPMQPLIDIWVGNGAIPADAANGACAIAPPQ
jgi:Mob1/phocein family